jgi:signal transduction histidine kinase
MSLNRISVKLGLAIILLVISILIPLSYSINQFFVRFYTEQTVSALVSDCEYIEDLIRKKGLTHFSNENLVFFSSMGSEMILVDEQYKVVLNTGVPNLKIGDPWGRQWLIDLNPDEVFRQETEEWIIVGMATEESGLAGIVLYTPKQPIIDAANQFQRMILLAGFGAILLAMGFTWVLSGRMVNPLLAMKETAQALSKGNFKVKIPTKGNDEIAQLGGAINQLADNLHRLQTSRKEFLSNVSHELRTPLSYVKGYSQALDEGMLKTEEDQKKYIKVIHQEANRLSRLVEDLFDLTQMDEGQLRLSKDKVDLNEVIQKMIHTTDPRAQAKNITLHYHASKSIPIVEGDHGRLSQVFFNLLDNAIRHTLNGGKVMVSTEARDDHVRITIQDAGSGISETELPYVFERFYRVDKSRARGSGGTGLGLAIVKQIVEGHDGSVEIDSVEGAGTTVTVILPTKKEGK